MIRPSRRGAISLRVLVGMLAVGAGAHLLLYAGVVTTAFARRSAELHRRSEPIPDLYREIAQRAEDLREVIWATDGTQDLTLRGQLAAQVRSTVPGGENRVLATQFASIPAEMRVPLARADDLLAQIQAALMEWAAVVELGREGAGTRSARADSLHDVLALHLLHAQGSGIGALAQQAAELRALANRGRQAAFVWFGVGALLFGPLLIIIWRRLGPPLADMERGFDQIRQGELTVRLPVHRLDEVGRLTLHFNEMAGILEERAASQGRFVAAGELVAGVAHEVNNPLMAISAIATNRLEDTAVMTDSVREDFVRVRAQARRAARLLSGLLRFVRRSGDEPPTLVSLNDVIVRALELVSFRFPVDEISVEESLAPGLPAVRAKPVGLEQVLVNLLSNAVQALVAVPTPRTLGVATWMEGGIVHAIVEDSGPGIHASMHERLFQPFATTKGIGGTGLGLFISRQIARAAGGDLRLAPGTMGGSRFVLSLPASDERPVPAPPVDMQDPDARSLAGITVMLVDDEPSVRGPVGTFLRRRGAVVVEAADGREALDALGKAGAGAVADVVVTDLRMPVMDGFALWEALRRTRPGLAERVLFLSGDIEAGAKDLEGPPPDRVLLKPVELTEIEARICRLLAASPA